MKTKQAREGDILLFEPGTVLLVKGSKELKTKKGEKWLVTESSSGGGGTGHGAGDVYPDAWQVQVIRLIKGRYNVHQPGASFNQMTTCYNYTIDEVKVIGKKRKTFV